MEKQDILVVAIAIMAFAVLALVAKPIIATQSFGVPSGGTGQQVTPSAPQTPAIRTTVPPTTTLPVTPSPAATPSWDGSVKAVGFVGQPEGQVTPPPNPTIPQPALENRSLVTYAVISNRWPGTTENLYIPTPWWVLEYTADPYALPPNAYPLLIIQIFDAQDPNRLITAPIKQPIYEEPPETPWSKKFYEGRRTYYFKVDSTFIRSYTLTIKVPQEYV